MRGSWIGPALAAPLALAASTPATAENWVEVSTSIEGTKVCVDRDSLQQEGWFGVIFRMKTCDSSDAPLKSLILCNEDFAKGATFKELQQDGTLRDILHVGPDAVGVHAAKFACQNR